MTAHRHPRVDTRFERPHRPTRSGTFHLLTSVVAPLASEQDRQDRPPLNLSFIVDRSGSMSGGKLDLARQGVEYALGMLDTRDSVSLVVYDNEVDRLLSQRPADGDARAKATRRLRRVQPRGSTALGEGWATGCRELAGIADSATPNTELCRAILLTDGLANVGETDPTLLARHAGEMAKRGVTTTTFGVGDSFDEMLLAGMADAGRGRYHYIANSTGIAPVFAGELGELLHVTMRNVTLTMRFPRGWRVQILNDLPLEINGQQQQLQLGDLSSGESRPVVWAIDAPDASAGDTDTVEVDLHWTTPDGLHTQVQSFHQAIQAQHEPGPQDEEVLSHMASMLGSRARAEALEHNRAGRYDLAQSSIRRYASAMPSSSAGGTQARELVELAKRVAGPLSAESRKAEHFRARRMTRSQRDYNEEP